VILPISWSCGFVDLAGIPGARSRKAIGRGPGRNIAVRPMTAAIAAR